MQSKFFRLAAALLVPSFFLAAGDAGAGETESSDGTCLSAEQRADIQRELDKFNAAHPELTTAGAKADPKIIAPPKIQFYPLGGLLTKDIWRRRFVDVDQTSGAFTDFECGTMTTDAHGGIDGEMGSFGYQDIGVPVFAALNGTVSAAHDTEDDQSVAATSKPANYVVVNHDNGFQSYYIHLKKNSVLVSVGQAVKAGQQIASMGSSGESALPQLHFEMEAGGVAYEPSFGSCNSKVGWDNQVPIRRDMFIRDFGIAAGTLTTGQKFPYAVPSTGSVVKGTPTFTIWYRLHNAPANSSVAIRLLRPDLSVISTINSSLGNANTILAANLYAPVTLSLSEVQTDQCEISVNGTKLLTAPFFVVSTVGDIVNHPPNAISAHFDPAAPATDRALMCIVDNDFVLDDPDYDIVRYRYRWKVNGEIRREVVSPALSDQFPRDSTVAGDTIRCEVYPLDAVSTGTLAAVEAGIAGTPSPTPSPTPTASQTPSLTPSVSPTASATATQTPTESPSPTETPTVSETPSTTPSPTQSPTPTETPSATPTETASATATETASATATETASATPTETATPSATQTATPSPSPTAAATSAGVLDFLLGRTGSGAGLDANTDGEVDIADLLQVFGQ